MDKPCNSNEATGRYGDENPLDDGAHSHPARRFSSGSFNGPFWPHDTANVDSMNAPTQRIGKLLVNGLAASIGEGGEIVRTLCFNAADTGNTLP